MRKKAANQFREEISKELRDAATILERARVCRDVGPLLSAANRCLRSSGDNWSYSVANLLFFGTNLKAFPQSLAEISCRLTVNAAGSCVLADEKRDPMTRLEIDIVLEASSLSTKHKHLQSWHFDRHNGGIFDSIVAHPRYHFSFGGRRLEEHAATSKIPFFDFLLLLDSPRLVHLPLDGVLAVDFVLSNFAAQSWNNLRGQRDYVALIQRAQRRNWKPFASALMAHWPVGAKDLPWQSTDVCPQLC
jgi:hypothetical protein